LCRRSKMVGRSPGQPGTPLGEPRTSAPDPSSRSADIMPAVVCRRPWALRARIHLADAPGPEAWTRKRGNVRSFRADCRRSPMRTPPGDVIAPPESPATLQRPKVGHVLPRRQYDAIVAAFGLADGRRAGIVVEIFRRYCNGLFFSRPLRAARRPGGSSIWSLSLSAGTGQARRSTGADKARQGRAISFDSGEGVRTAERWDHRPNKSLPEFCCTRQGPNAGSDPFWRQSSRSLCRQNLI